MGHGELQEKRGSKVEQRQSQSVWPGREPTSYAKTTNKLGEEVRVRVGGHSESKHSKDAGRRNADWKPGQTADDIRKELDLYARTGGVSLRPEEER